MRIFYFKGWNSQFDESIYKVLSKFGDEVIYPEINYHNSRNLINAYANEVYKNRALIVGSSLGGYIGYHIANITHFPTLLFNPTLFFKSGGELRPCHGSSNNENFEKMFIFSAKDDDIDVKRTLKFLKEAKHSDDNIKIYDSLNQMPLDIFENEFTAFREKYKDHFQETKPDDKLFDKETKKVSSKKISGSGYSGYRTTYGNDEDVGFLNTTGTSTVRATVTADGIRNESIEYKAASKKIKSNPIEQLPQIENYPEPVANVEPDPTPIDHDRWWSGL